jgi:hypothetical protein
LQYAVNAVSSIVVQQPDLADFLFFYQSRQGFVAVSKRRHL